MALLRGIDVSGADVNWSEVGASGVSFASFKLSEGEDLPDPKGTRERYRKAHRAGLFVFPYHLLRPRHRDPKRETRFFAKRLRAIGYPSRGDLPPALDIEVTDLAPAATLEYLEGACRALLEERLHPHGIQVYGPPAFLDEI